MIGNVEKLTKVQPVVMKQLQTIYEKNRTGHAYIFDGAKGTGKREVAIFFAKVMFMS